MANKRFWRQRTSAVLLAAFLSGCSVGPGASDAQSAGPSAVSSPTLDPSAVASAAPSTGDAPSASPAQAPAQGVPGDVFPPGLAGRTWVAAGPDGAPTVGTVGSSARFNLVPGTILLAADGGRIALSAIHGNAGSTITIASPDGKPLQHFVVGFDATAGALVGDQLIVTGNDPSLASDPGLIAISLSDGSVKTILTPANGTKGQTLSRSLVVSPSRQTLATALCRPDGCSSAQTINAATMAVGPLPASDGSPSALSDDLVLMRVGGESGAGLAAVSVASNKVAWSASGDEYQQCYFTASGNLVLARIHHGGSFTFQVVTIDPAGKERVLFDRNGDEGWTLWPEFSTDAFAAVSRGANLMDVADKDAVASTIGLDTASFTPAAIKVSLCPDRCSVIE